MGQFPGNRPVDSLEQVLHRRICSVCIDQNVDGSCTLRDEDKCALFSQFPKVAKAVSRVYSDSIDDYVDAIREDVCSECANQDGSGVCKVRNEIRCVLDRYLLLIVEAMEETQGRTMVRSDG